MKTLFIFLFFASFAKATEYDFGNGGHVVICDNGQSSTKTYELLDFYEAKRFQAIGWRHFQLIDSLQMKESLQAAAKKNAFLNYFTKAANQLTAERRLRFVFNQRLPETNDHNTIFIPGTNCKIEQLAFHRDFPTLGFPIFHIYKPFWDKLSKVSQIGLYHHEVIYFFLNKVFSDTDSLRARYLNSLLFSKKSYTKKEYEDILTGIGLYPQMEIVDTPINKSFTRTYLWKDQAKNFLIEGQSCSYQNYKITKKLLAKTKKTVTIKNTVKPYFSLMNNSLFCREIQEFTYTEVKNIKELKEEYLKIINQGLKEAVDNSLLVLDNRFQIKYSSKEWVLFPFKLFRSNFLNISKRDQSN